jgi:hypothetical protein
MMLEITDLAQQDFSDILHYGYEPCSPLAGERMKQGFPLRKP